MELKQIKKENSDLKKEIDYLKKKLAIAKLWMEKDVKYYIKKIAKWKISKTTLDNKDLFFWENIEDIITKKISDYFGEIILLNIPTSVIENIISAEINYFNLKENPKADWLGVITSYHKSADIIIEKFITKWFRKFAIKKWQTSLRTNITIEKFLHAIVNDWYIFSMWRLYHILIFIKENSLLYDYGKCFKEYLEKNEHLLNVLLDEDFIKNFEFLVSSEILGKKRHVWKISFTETKQARKVFIWDLIDKNSLIYKLVELTKIDC